jgi:hypothetical protein
MRKVPRQQKIFTTAPHLDVLQSPSIDQIRRVVAAYGWAAAPAAENHWRDKKGNLVDCFGVKHCGSQVTAAFDEQSGYSFLAKL